MFSVDKSIFSSEREVVEELGEPRELELVSVSRSSED